MQVKKKLELDVNVHEEENGFRITFTSRTGTFGSKKLEYVARSLEEFFTTASLDAVKKLE